MDKEMMMNKYMIDRIIELGVDVGTAQAEVNRLEDLLEESRSQVSRLLGDKSSHESDMKRIQSDFIAMMDGTATKIQLIKMYRIIMGAGLRESKEGIENSEFYRRWQAGCMACRDD